jgi:predicted O-methyltransferase YrrM
MSFASKVATAAWFARRPAFWRQAAQLVRLKFVRDMDSPERRAKAGEWAAERAVPREAALESIGLLGRGNSMPELSPASLAQAEERARRATVEMGGAGDLALIYAAARLSGARRAVETGVAYGWSSLAILAALRDNGGGQLASVDMPYAKRDNERFVGIAVTDDLRASWTLIRLPDRNGLKHAIAGLGGSIDLAHYDSDKTYYGRRFAYPLMWRALEPGGVFISDDIQDNMRFAEFVAEQGVAFAVTECAGKFVGICRKP